MAIWLGVMVAGKRRGGAHPIFLVFCKRESFAFAFFRIYTVCPMTNDHSNSLNGSNVINTVNNNLGNPSNQSMSLDDLPFLLKLYGLKVTSGRLKLLEILLQEKGPVSVELIKQKLDKKLDLASIYRALQALVSAELVQRIGLDPDRAYYELIAGRKHHHHIVCVACGVLEDIDMCNTHSLQNAARKVSRKFFKITDHSLEFSGICRKCNLRKALLIK